MEAISRLISGRSKGQPLKAGAKNANEYSNIGAGERSDFAESEGVAPAGCTRTSERIKAQLLEKTGELHTLQQHYDELSHAHRNQRLTLREVADTKKSNTELEETLQKRSKELQKAQGRYASLLREHKAKMKEDVEELALTRKNAENIFRSHQQEMTAINGALTSQTEDLNNTKRLKRAAENRSEQLRSELEITQGQLRLCKDDLFRLQPMAQVPDTEIVKEFGSICQDVIGWIDIEISAFEKSYPSAEPSKIFSGGRFPNIRYMLEQFPTFGEYWVRYVVHNCLYGTIFSRSVYLLGLPEKTKQCLQAAEERMASLEPPRDAKTIHAWRSETLTAIAATPDYAADREAEINDIVQSIFQTVGEFFPIISLEAQSKQRLLGEVVLPAAKLASKIHVAASIYEFWHSRKLFQENNSVTLGDHEFMKMVDVKTRKIIKGSSATSQDGERPIGDIVIPLEPGLWRINENDGNTLLRLEVNLIKLD